MTTERVPLPENRRRGILLSAIASVAAIVTRGVVGFAALPLVHHYLGPEAFAVWAIVQSISGYFGLSEAGIGQAVANEQGRLYADHDIPGINRVVASATGLYLVIVVPLALIAILAVGLMDVQSWIPRETSRPLQLLLPWLLRATITAILMSVPLVAFAATLSGARYHHVRQLLDASLPLCTLAALAIALRAGAGIWGASLVAPAVTVVGGFVAWAILKRIIRGVELDLRHFSFIEARRLIGHSMFFSLIGFALVGNRSIPALLTGRSGSASEVAQIFSAALIFRVLGWAALDSITRVLQPYTVLDQHRGAMARVLETTQAAVLATNSAAFSFVLIMLSFGVPLSALWLGDSGRIEFGVIAPFAIAFMLDVSLLPIANTLIALNRQRRLAIVMFAQPILLIFFTRLVTPIWFSTHPVRGLLLSVVLSSAATVLLFVVVVARDGLELSARQFGHRFLPRMLVPLSVVVATAMALAAFQPVSLVMSGVVFLVVGIGMGFAVWRFLATGAERAAVLGLLRVGAGRPL